MLCFRVITFKLNKYKRKYKIKDKWKNLANLTLPLIVGLCSDSPSDVFSRLSSLSTIWICFSFALLSLGTDLARHECYSLAICNKAVLNGINSVTSSSLLSSSTVTCFVIFSSSFKTKASSKCNLFC